MNSIVNRIAKIKNQNLLPDQITLAWSPPPIWSGSRFCYKALAAQCDKDRPIGAP